MFVTHFISITVQAIYAKSGGKNAKHGSVEDSNTIGALSNIAVQIFEHTYGRQFRSITQATSTLQTNQYALLPPLNFLCKLNNSPTLTPGGLVLHQNDEALFKELQGASQRLSEAMVLSRRRGKNAVQVQLEKD